jgi:probable HAF family extracellular repeat protein
MAGVRRGLVGVVAVWVAGLLAPVGVGAVPAPASAPGGAGGPITVTELTDPEGRPLVGVLAINERGQVLGLMEDDDGLGIVVWSARDGARRVDPPGAVGYPFPEDISERGQVVGTDQAAQRAFSWSDGEFSWLEPEGVDSSAAAVNDRGQVAGSRGVLPTPLDVVAWQGDDLEVVESPWGPRGVPTDVNERGQALLGRTVWQIGGGITELGTLGAATDVYTQGMVINERGQVAGQAQTAEGDLHAFLWQRGRMRDLGTLGGAWSYVTQSEVDTSRVLNERGHVVGYSETADRRPHAFLWRDGEMADLGTLGGYVSTAVAINRHDQVVGYSETAMGAWDAFLWQDGRMIDLSAGDPGSSSAVDINDRGQIVGAIGSRSVMWTVHAGGH